MTSRTPRLVRCASTRYWGLVALPSLASGYVVASSASPPWTWTAVPLVGLGVVGVMLTARSVSRRQRGRSAAFGDREVIVLSRAHAYAFRAVAVAAVLFLFYASLASQPERHWWMPRSSRQWRSILWPLVLSLPILPALIAEWLGPAEPEAEDHE